MARVSYKVPSSDLHHCNLLDTHDTSRISVDCRIPSGFTKNLQLYITKVTRECKFRSYYGNNLVFRIQVWHFWQIFSSYCRHKLTDVGDSAWLTPPSSSLRNCFLATRNKYATDCIVLCFLFHFFFAISINALQARSINHSAMTAPSTLPLPQNRMWRK